MKPVKQPRLRRIAENELNRHLGELDAAVRNELATSLVRQWLTNDGHAGLAFPSCHCWFQLVRKSDGYEVGFGRTEVSGSRTLLRDWQVDEAKIPAVLHQLNVCQSVQCPTMDGRTIRLWLEPKERVVQCRKLAEGEQEQQ
jgi:hypothetical protein